MHRAKGIRLLLPVLGTVLSLLSCRSAPEPAPGPLAAPPAKVRARSFAGGPLAEIRGNAALDAEGGPSGRVEPAVDSARRQVDALHVRVSLTALERLPADAGEPLAAKARLIAGGRSRPILPAPRLLAGTRVGGEDPERVIEDRGKARRVSIGTWTGEVLPGTTWVLDAGDSQTGPAGPTGAPAWRHVEILVHRPAAANRPEDAQLAVAKQDLGAVEPLSETAGVPPEARPERPPELEFGSELAMIEGPPGDDRPVRLVIPFRFEGGATEAVDALIEVSRTAFPPREIPGPPAATAMPSTAPEPARPPGPPADPGRLEVESALGSLASPVLRRRGLLFLAGRTGARLSEDLALAADDGTLARIAEKVRGAVEAPGATRNPADLGFTLERSAYEVIAGLLAEERVPPGLEGTVALHAGEAGRDPSSIEEVLRGASGIEALEKRIVEENRIALEDPSPAARVRAFDWLRARGLAPGGFDPLGSAGERRKALEEDAETPGPAAPAGGDKP